MKKFISVPLLSTFLTNQSFQYVMVSTLVMHCSVVSAGVGNNAMTHGLLNHDVASAQAFSLFHAEPSASYYNPANLVAGDQQQLHVGAMYNEPAIELTSLGGANPPTRIGQTIDVDESASVLLGFKSSLNGLITTERPISYGIVAALEGFGSTALTVNDSTSLDGQVLQYGEKPLFVSTGVGVELIPGFRAGFGATVSLGTEASLDIESTLGGVTRNERIEIEATTRISPVVGFNLELSKLACSGVDSRDEQESCRVPNWQLAFAFKGESKTETDVEAKAVVPGVISDPGLNLILAAQDGYQPNIATLGLFAPLQEGFALAFTVEWQEWSGLKDILEPSNTNATLDQADVQLDDVVIPRVGVSYYHRAWSFTAGYAFEESALKPGLTPDANLLDNDRHVFGFGASYRFPKVPLLAYPVTVGAVFQHHRLRDETFELSRIANGIETYETVETGGNVNALNLSFAIKH